MTCGHDTWTLIFARTQYLAMASGGQLIAHMQYSVAMLGCWLLLSCSVWPWPPYLAMASGGQIIARMARSQMQLPQGQGTKAFEFGPAANASELKVGLKSRMDGLGEVISDNERQQSMLVSSELNFPSELNFN
eukprot:1156533-Pelagomonas_calceolata.AAC.5